MRRLATRRGLRFSEALLGAGLVLFRLVAQDESLARAMVMPLHLANTLILLLCLTLTAHFLSGGAPVSIFPTPMIGMVGLLEDVARALPSQFVREGDVVALFGETRDELGASLTSSAALDLTAILDAEVSDRSEFHCRDARCQTLCPIERTTIAVGGDTRIAISGGADSVALTWLLQALAVGEGPEIAGLGRRALALLPPAGRQRWRPGGPAASIGLFSGSAAARCGRRAGPASAR